MSRIRVPMPRLGGRSTVGITTMGCKVNSFESELIAEKLAALGYSRDDRAASADIRIINTCTVTAEADRQARQQVRRIIRQDPEALVVMTGCYAQTDPEACAAIPGVDLVVGNARKLEIPRLLEPLLKGEIPPLLVDDVTGDIGLPDELVSGFEGRSRAFVQIQQGCDRGCTFCIIHTARGPNRSFSPAMIRRQVQRLVMNGYHEVVLCGVDIGSYGDDLEDHVCLESLLEELLTLDMPFRLRLSSIDPAHVSDRLAGIMASHRDRICPHLHLSLQSGNTLILKRMRRRATREVLFERIGALKGRVPGLVLSADIMVGFPTEDDHHFAETLDAVDQLEIAFPHVFSYSKRPGTPAARIPNQVAPAIKKQRAAGIRIAGERVRDHQGRQLVGRTLPVLPEIGRTGSPGRRVARADNYFNVSTASAGEWDSGWREVEITGFDRGVLIAGGG